MMRSLWSVLQTEDSSTTQLYADATVVAILELLTKTDATSSTRVVGGRSPGALKRALDLLEGATTGGDVSLLSLPEASGLSPAHFCRAFKMTTGLPPHRWLIQRRIGRACDLLATGL